MQTQIRQTKVRQTKIRHAATLRSPGELLRYKKEQQAAILKRLRENPRAVMIRVAAPAHCVVGQTVQGVYAKEDAPELPIEGCPLEAGCICTYEPVLDDIYP